MRRLLAICAVLLLAACQQPAPPARPDVSFTRYQPLYMDVNTIDVVEDYKSPRALPNIEHLLPQSPADAMRTWVKDRLRTTGANRRLEVHIKDASVLATPLPKQSGIEGVFSPDAKRYDARIEVEMRVYGTVSAMSEASIDVAATRSVTINESASLSERNTIFRDMTYQLMESLNAEIEKNMFLYLSNYISYAKSP